MLHVTRRKFACGHALFGLLLVLLPAGSAAETQLRLQGATPGVYFVIDKAMQQLTVYVDGVQQRAFPTSTARAGYETPSGTFHPTLMLRMHYSCRYNNAPMPHSIFFTRVGRGIHGTTEVRNLGRRASHGGVRLASGAAAWLFELVQRYGMDSTTIRVFRARRRLMRQLVLLLLNGIRRGEAASERCAAQLQGITGEMA